jgi:hypothetical protein
MVSYPYCEAEGEAVLDSERLCLTVTKISQLKVLELHEGYSGVKGWLAMEVIPR